MDLFANPVGCLLTCGLSFALVLQNATHFAFLSGSWNQSPSLVIKPRLGNQAQALFSLRKLRFPNNSNRVSQKAHILGQFRFQPYMTKTGRRQKTAKRSLFYKTYFNKQPGY
jgi:hypothetical protein